MVVGHLRIVENPLGLREPCRQNLSRQRSVGGHLAEDIRYFWINIVSKIRGINSGIGGHLLLIQRLNQLERFVGGPSEFLVTFHLKRSKVEQPRRLFLPFLLLYAGDGKRRSLDCLYSLLSFLFIGETAGGSVECHIAVEGFQFPEIFRFEFSYLFLSLHDERKRRSLHTSD